MFTTTMLTGLDVRASVAEKFKRGCKSIGVDPVDQVGALIASWQARGRPDLEVGEAAGTYDVGVLWVHGGFELPVKEYAVNRGVQVGQVVEALILDWLENDARF